MHEDSPDSVVRKGRRLRLTTLDEQHEFVRLAQQLLSSGTAEDELRTELGYDDVDAFRKAVENGRVTTERLDRLREFSRDRLPDMIHRKQIESERITEERMRRLRERFETTPALPPGGGSGEGTPTPEVSAPGVTKKTEAKAPREPKMGRRRKKRRKEYLEPQQHRRLREQIEHLWAVDKRFRNWSLLSKAAGLSSGQAVKRAYEVNSSAGTLRNIETFARLHAGFGSRATEALKAGVPVEQLQAHLTGEQDAGPGTGGSEKAARPEASVTMDQLGETPPSVDFASMIELGEAIDREVKRLWLLSRFFGDIAGRATLPRLVRDSAAQTRDHLDRAIATFAPTGEEPAADQPVADQPDGRS
jgi:hypothetical protein